MRKPSGYGFGVTLAGIFEVDTITCNHCGGIHEVPVGQQPDFCRVCASHICQKPQCHQGCRPFELEIERMEKAFAKQVAIAEWG